MHPLQNGSQDTTRPPKKPLTGPAGWFTESGDNNVPSYPGADWFNHVIAEFQNMLDGQGLEFDPDSDLNFDKALKRVESEKPPAEYDLFVIYGQSNAVGFADNSIGRQELPSHCEFWTRRVPPAKWNDIVYDMEYVQPGGVVSSGHAWVEFAREYTKRTGRGVLYVPAAFGGKTISELSKGSSYYTNLLAAISEVDADSTHTISRKILLWCQGESDMTAGTTRDQYQTQFITLWNDLKSEAGLEFCYMSRVGNPQDRAEPSRYAVQVAQDYICDNVLDVAMAFDAAGAFTSSNYMLQDGVHYSQKGYNLMGYQMGKFAAQREIDNSAMTSVDADQFNGITTTGDQVHRLVAATLIHDGANWVLKSVSDGGEYRASFVESIMVESTRIVLTLPMRVQDVVSVQTQFNKVGNDEGLVAGVSLGSSTNTLVVELNADTTAFVDTETGEISYPPNGAGAVSGLLSDLSATIDGGITKLTYQGCKQSPIVTPHTTSNLTEFIPVAQKNVSFNQLWFKYQSPAADSRAIVNFKAKQVDPSAITLSALQLNISAVIGERAL
ncbi:sialate O-acetylesterase [Vibrio splendidus]